MEVEDVREAASKAGTGGEALQLRNQDVDLERGVITVLGAKFGKTRFVPLASDSDLVARLKAYRTDITTHGGDSEASAAFFPGPDGHHPGGRTGLYRSFRRALDIAGIIHRGVGRGPQCHDLRHAFAVLRLLSWYKQGEDLKAKLPLLATYLGHVGMASSQVYLHMTQDFVGEVARRQQQHFPDLITAEPNS